MTTLVRMLRRLPDRAQASPWRPGTTSIVGEVGGDGPVRQRLLDLGLRPGVEVRLVRVAPGGDPVWLALGHTHLALRRAEAEALNLSPA